MGRVVRHILTATALVGITTGEGNGLPVQILPSSSSAQPLVAGIASVAVGLPSSLAVPSVSINAGLSVSANANLGLPSSIVLPSASINAGLSISANANLGLPSSVAIPNVSLNAGLSVGVNISVGIPSSLAVPSANINLGLSIGANASVGIPSSVALPSASINAGLSIGANVSLGLPPSIAIPSASINAGLSIGANVSAGLPLSLALPSPSINAGLSVGANINASLPSSLAIPSVSANAGLSINADASLSLGAGKSATSSNTNPSPAPNPLLSGLNNLVNGVGGVVGDVASGLGSAVAAVATPVASGLGSVVSGAAQVVNAVNDTANAAVAAIPPVVSGVGNVVDGLGKTVNTTAVGVTGLAGGLLDVTLSGVSDILTNLTFALLNSAPIQLVDDLAEALLHPHPRDPNLRGWQYFGCFYPSLYLSGKAVLQVTDVTVAMSASICINLCVQSAMDFATVRGNQCFCSNDVPGINTWPDKNYGTDKCNLLCLGSLTEYCGGSGGGDNAAMSVYKRVISLATILRPAYPPRWRYSSCFYTGAWLSLLTPANSYIFTPPNGTDGTQCSALCYARNSTYTTAAVSGPTCYCSTLAISASLWAGLGECSNPCTSNSTETCGGTSKLGAALGVAYIRRPAPPVTSPPVPGAPAPFGWSNYGCYFGAVYLLDTILTGLQASSLLDLDPDMSGSKCIATCRASSYAYALVIGGVCFCNDKPPTRDLGVVSQLLCNLPCPNHGTERCGGETDGGNGPRGRSLITVFGEDPPPKV